MQAHTHLPDAKKREPNGPPVAVCGASSWTISMEKPERPVTCPDCKAALKMGRRQKPQYELRVTADEDDVTQYTLTHLPTREVIVETPDQAVALSELRRVDPEFST